MRSRECRPKLVRVNVARMKMKKVICLLAVLFLLGCLLLAVSAERPVRFEDVNLRRAVNHALGDPGVRDDWVDRVHRIVRSAVGLKGGPQEYLPKPSDMLMLQALSARDLQFVVLHLGGIEYAGSLTKLELNRQHIADSELENLRELSLSHNRIKDISALAGLTNLKVLELEGNQIGNISALVNLRGLESMNLKDNPLNGEAYDVHLPQIVANNPGMKLIVDPKKSPARQ